MAKGIGRSLVIGLSADTRKFNKNIKQSQQDLAHFKDGIGKLGKAAAAGFGAMAIAAGAFAKTAVEAAVEDEKSQKQLARTIKANVKSHKDLAGAMEKSISGIQKASGISDTKLRKSFGKLIVTTKSVTKSQKIMRTALNVSAGTGKDLDTVVQALSKAYLGNNTALGRLGTGLSKAELKAMSFNDAQTKLDKTFKGASATAANTMQGKLDRLKTAYGEVVEKVGYALLPKLQKLAGWLINTGVPNFETFVGVFTGEKGFNQALKDGTTGAYNLGQKVKGGLDWVWKHRKDFEAVAAAFTTMWAVGKIASAVSVIVGAYKSITTAAALAAGAEAAASGGGSFYAALPAITAIGAMFGVAAFNNIGVGTAQSAGGTNPEMEQYLKNYGPNAGTTLTPNSARTKKGLIWFNGKQVFERPYMHSAKNQPLIGQHKAASGTWPGLGYNSNPPYDPIKGSGAPARALGGPVSARQAYMVGERGPEVFVPRTGGKIIPNGGSNITINVTGALDPNAVAKQIAQVLRNAGLSTGNVQLAGRITP